MPIRLIRIVRNYSLIGLVLGTLSASAADVGQGGTDDQSPPKRLRPTQVHFADGSALPADEGPSILTAVPPSAPTPAPRPPAGPKATDAAEPGALPPPPASPPPMGAATAEKMETTAAVHRWSQCRSRNTSAPPKSRSPVSMASHLPSAPERTWKRPGESPRKRASSDSGYHAIVFRRPVSAGRSCLYRGQQGGVAGNTFRTRLPLRPGRGAVGTLQGPTRVGFERVGRGPWTVVSRARRTFLV